MDLLHQQDKNWRETSVLLQDNLPLHKSQAVVEMIKTKRIPMLNTGVASCTAGPVERVNAHVKQSYKRMCALSD